MKAQYYIILLYNYDMNTTHGHDISAVVAAFPHKNACAPAFLWVCAEKCNFLGVSVLGESPDDVGAVYVGGVYVGSVAEDGAAAADGRVSAGDVLIRVNEVSLEKVSGSMAVQVLRDAVKKPGPLTLTLLKFWDPKPTGVFMLPRGEPVRPIDPASWVWHTAAMTGKLPPPYGEDEHLSVDSDMATVVKAMMKSDSGVAVRDRMWIKIVIPDAFTGSDAVRWLRRNLVGVAKRADALRYAAELLERRFIRHAVNAQTHKRFAQQRYYVVGDLTKMAPTDHRDGRGRGADLCTTSSGDCLDHGDQSDQKDHLDRTLTSLTTMDQSDHWDRFDHRDHSDHRN
ncbi:segment polarity protein dishevelled homolog DVL-3-like [Phycodurus eques]|uniref:segment polarity protein dishevelled homolog DVL-3-like n=1 Tax=Phycodurus eques TaxID=693459 RepID=UPI002ACEA140|nr:segment polarity protein dishevelled homolog DVL-3-like [Phycodurus eques]